MRETVIEMLSNGVPSTAIASALGLLDEEVSVILSEEDIEREVQERRAQRFASQLEIDKRVERAESAILEKIESLIPYQTKVANAVAIYRVLNQAKRKTGDSGANPQAPSGTVVQLNLPPTARVNMLLTPDKQVIAIEGQTLNPMPAKQVANILEARRLLTKAREPSQLSMKL